MSYISKINPETAGEKEKKVIEEHLAQGYKLTNEKLTLLHNAEAFNAIEASSYALDLGASETDRQAGRRLFRVCHLGGKRLPGMQHVFQKASERERNRFRYL